MIIINNDINLHLNVLLVVYFISNELLVWFSFILGAFREAWALYSFCFVKWSGWRSIFYQILVGFRRLLGGPRYLPSPNRAGSKEAEVQAGPGPNYRPRSNRPGSKWARVPNRRGSK